MTRVALLLCVLVLSALVPGHASAASYSSPMNGNVAGFRLAGVEPDGDPLYQVLMAMTLPPANGVPRMHLLVNAYMENFKPDTTPILPDLIHPNQTAHNLGGFLQGKALLTDDAGDVLTSGAFLAEAFLDNTNHAVATLSNQSASHSTAATFKGAFTLRKNAALDGHLQGHIVLSPSARRLIQRHHGATMRSITDILKAVSVKPHPMMGRSTSGSSSAPLQTGYSHAVSKPQHTLSPLTVITAMGALISFLLAGVLWWWQRRPKASE
jgi:hypothetical protein